MISLSLVQLAIGVVAIMINILLMVAVYRNDSRSATNRIFVWLGVVSSLWLVFMYSSVHPFFINYAEFMVRMTIFFATPMSFLFFLLAKNIPDKKFVLSKKVLYGFLGLVIAVMSVSLTPLVFSDVKIIEGSPAPVPGIALPLFVVLSSFFSIGAVYHLFVKYIKATGSVKKQLLFVNLGIGLMLGLIILTILVPAIFFEDNFFVPFAPVYLFTFLALTAFSILRYKLFDIKVIATEFAIIMLFCIIIFDGILSGSYGNMMYKFTIAIGIGILGASVVRSAYREVARQEKLTSLTHSLEKANIRLKELDQQKTEFLSIASHQLRTPLSIIKGYIELINDGAYGKPTKKLQTVLTNMDESNERLVKLVDEFLDITRIEQGRTKFSFEQSSINELVTGVVKELKDRAKSAGISIRSVRSDEIDTVYMDPEKVRHVVFNYIDNAIKYSADGKEIVVRVEYERNGCTFRVQDQGLGFNTTDHASFFQKFYRGENVKGTNVNGTGLGIYVCRKFIEAHGGHVWAKSDGLGKGSEFGFWIPEKSK